MRFFLSLGMEKFAWAARRLHCPVRNDALVLEVGSGGNPYARANVLLDAYENTQERHWAPLTTDRPTVLGFVENLPFKDKSFDFVIASHVFEHSSEPEIFLRELQRVGKAGYIEVPDAFMERINPYRDHRLEVTVRNNRLMIMKKKTSIIDDELVELYSDRAKRYIAGALIPNHPFAFHVRYYWDEEIDFSVVNPEVDISWRAEEQQQRVNTNSNGLKIRQKIQNLLRKWMSQTKRNSNIDLLSLLRCPTCQSDNITLDDNQYFCKSCETAYAIRDKVIKMYPQNEMKSLCR